MITREELLSSKEYWLTQIQNELFRLVDEYLETNNMNRTQFADKIGVVIQMSDTLKVFDI